jgi:phage/plasmid-associated DNA primase
MAGSETSSEPMRKELVCQFDVWRLYQLYQLCHLYQLYQLCHLQSGHLLSMEKTRENESNVVEVAVPRYAARSFWR